MAIVGNPEGSRGILGAIKGALSLFGDTNKAQGVSEVDEIIPQDEYESSLSEDEIIKLVRGWKKTYSPYNSDIDKTQQLAYNYWIGKQRPDDSAIGSNTGSDKSVSDNLLFEALETFLPIATRANPDPLVSADPTEVGQNLAKDIKTALVNWADTQKLRRKLARMTRHWALYRLGVAKMNWDVKTKEIKLEIVNPRRFIFDKEGHIDEGGRFIGSYIGEKKKLSANELTDMFPKHKEFIIEKAGGKDFMGTVLEYYEWWYQGKDVFYTLEDKVLGKFKNPHWNYSGTIKETDPETGAETENEIQGVNHFKEPAYPYIFLAVFNTGLSPHDDTSLMLQNIGIQDLINRRYKQIDRNVDGMNNGMVVSGTSFTEEQASQAANALRKGMAIRVPNGHVSDAVVFPQRPPLPGDVFKSLEDGRNELRNIFGTSGSTPEGVSQEKSVRGKIMVSQQDSSRIGGGVTEQIEQVADYVYNQVVQFMFVYYDEEHFLTSAGQMGGMELIMLKNDRFPGLKTLQITVKEGSLIPKDPLTQRNEAIDLWSSGAIDPLNFFKKLDFPDPAQATNQLILWQMLQKGAIQPQMYLPSFQIASQPQQMGMPGQMPPPQGVGGPAVNPLGPQEQQPAPEPNTQGAVQAESKQLLGSVPI